MVYTGRDREREKGWNVEGDITIMRQRQSGQREGACAKKAGRVTDEFGPGREIDGGGYGFCMVAKGKGRKGYRNRRLESLVEEDLEARYSRMDGV